MVGVDLADHVGRVSQREQPVGSIDRFELSTLDIHLHKPRRPADGAVEVSVEADRFHRETGRNYTCKQLN